MQIEQRNVPILMYHSISHCATAAFRPFTVSAALFAEQMGYLDRHGYTPITVTQFIQARTGALLPKRPVVLTFDDGFADFFLEALPVLRRFGFQATLYVATSYVNRTSGWLRREGEDTRHMLAWEQLSELSTAGIECGAHSHTHCPLDTLPLARARDEIVRSKQLLEERLGREILSFAYPYGYHTTAIKEMVRAAGFTSACAVKHALSSTTTDPFALARLMVRPDMHVDSFAQILMGRVASPLASLYIRSRTPVWQLVRRGAAAMTGCLQGASYRKQV